MTQIDETPPRKRNWLLIGSLALNLIIIGALAGGAIAGGGKHKRGGPSAQAQAWPFVFRALPKPHRADAFKGLELNRDAHKERRREMRVMRENLIAALQSEPFDASPIEALVADQAALVSAAQAEAGRVLLEAINAMSPEERAAYAQNLQNPRKFPSPKRH